MKSGNGSWRWKRTREGPTISTSRTRSLSALPTFDRWKLNFTSSAVNGSPLWNFRPSRSLNSYVRWSALTVHDSARLGAMRLPGIGFTSAACRAKSSQKGVRKPSVTSPGSNQAGASVTYRAQRISPSGLAMGAGRGWADALETRADTISKAIRSRFMAGSIIPAPHRKEQRHEDVARDQSEGEGAGARDVVELPGLWQPVLRRRHDRGRRHGRPAR